MIVTTIRLKKTLSEDEIKDITSQCEFEFNNRIGECKNNSKDIYTLLFETSDYSLAGLANSNLGRNKKLFSKFEEWYVDYDGETKEDCIEIFTELNLSYGRYY